MPNPPPFSFDSNNEARSNAGFLFCLIQTTRKIVLDTEISLCYYCDIVRIVRTQKHMGAQMAKPLTILDIASAMGAKRDETGAISMAEFNRLDLPFFAGCEQCAASLAPYNSYPSQSGFIRCKDCIDDYGFATIEEFNAAFDSNEAE